MPKRELKPRVEFDGKGRVTIPKWLRDDLKIQKGTRAEIELYDRKILLTLLG